MYRKQQSEEYLQKVTKAALATPTDSAVAMGLSLRLPLITGH